MSRARTGGAVMNGSGRHTSTPAAPTRAVSAPLKAPSPSRRDKAGIPFMEALRYHRWHMLIGVVMGLACYEASALVLAWMSPVIVGLIFAAPLTWLTSRAAARPLRTLLSTRDGRSPPAIVESARRATGEWADHIAMRSAENVVEIAIRAA